MSTVSKPKRIQPRTLKGFRDYLPNQMIARERLIETARDVYRSYGFSPIDTPALEYAEVLTGKGGQESDKQLFRFEDSGGRDVAMRFDLTVPLARFAAQYINELGTPFKRYHIASVWRGEKPQAGRYREFMQCDFDTVGTTSNVADIETLLVIHDLIAKIGFERFTIRVNNRMVLNGLLEQHSVAEHSTEILRALDKLPKIGRDKVLDEMVDVVGLGREQADGVLQLSDLSGERTAVLDQLAEMLKENEQGTEGVARLRELFATATAAGIPDDRLVLDLSIARGLDYYTGTIYETFLSDLPGIGSVCSGGRYDNLANLFTSQSLPGVGASLGLDRLLAAMETLELIDSAATPAAVLVTIMDSNRLGDYMRVARMLRLAGIATEVYADTKNFGKQMKYANRKGFRLALIAGDDEFASGQWQIKDLQNGEQQAISENELIDVIQTRI